MCLACLAACCWQGYPWPCQFVNLQHREATESDSQSGILQAQTPKTLKSPEVKERKLVGCGSHARLPLLDLFREIVSFLNGS